MSEKHEWHREAVGALVLAGALALGSAATQAAGERLTGDALKHNVSGRTFTGLSSRGKTWESDYAANGRLDVRVPGTSWTDTGTWEIRDDRVCSERGKRSYTCYEVFQPAPGVFEFVDERGQTTKASHKR